MKRFIGVSSMSHENKGVRALPPETFETGEPFRTPLLVCEDYHSSDLQLDIEAHMPQSAAETRAHGGAAGRPFTRDIRAKSGTLGILAISGVA